MTRMIERWFPCEEVSQNTGSGWGSGRSEKALFTWFAARPLAQAKAAVICSLLPWPKTTREQERLQRLVREAMSGRDAAHELLVSELSKVYPAGASMLDPFSGRGMIPLEAARLDVKAWGVDYSPVATLAGSLLADYPLRDWETEPALPFEGYVMDDPDAWGTPRLLRDVDFILNLIGDRYESEMSPYYPRQNGRIPWGYLWAVTLPCQACQRRFPLTGSLVLRHPLPKKNDEGQSYRIVTDLETGTFHAEVHPGPPVGAPTLVTRQGSRGKVAVCPFCEHVHLKDVHTRLMQDGLSGDALLVVADIDDTVGKSFRSPSTEDVAAVRAASVDLAVEPAFAPGLSAIPDEQVPPGNNHTVRPSLYGYRSYGEFCNERQTLGFVRLARIVQSVSQELIEAGLSHDYVAALAGYAGANLVRRIKYSTRGTTLRSHNHATSNRVQTDHIFTNEASVAFSYDYFETACGDGPGTWRSMTPDTTAALRNQFERSPGRAGIIQQGTAMSLPMPDESLDVVVTDPPYDSMIDYSDASDLLYVWLKRALLVSHPSFAMTSHPLGVQEKADEAIVKGGGKKVGDHRTDAHYDRCITGAFEQARMKVKSDGVVTIVFGHGDPEVWHRLLGSITGAGLILTGSWPARTESGGRAGFANIETTLTLACRPAPTDRSAGRVAEVDNEVRREIGERIPLWEAAGLALSDQLMASAGPAMEVVGRYSEVLDKRGEPVALDRYLPLARKFVEEAADIRIDALPLGTFDDKTRFGLFWARANGRNVMPGSEARWQRLAADLTDDETEGILVKAGKGVRLAFGSEHGPEVGPTSSAIDVALAASAKGKSLADAAEVLVASDRTNDEFLWACIGELSRAVPEADEDGEVWTWLVRNRQQVVSATRNVEAARAREVAEESATLFDRTLFDADAVGEN